MEQNKEKDLFTFESVMEKPKRMPAKYVGGQEYELRHANGFIKIYNQKGITYVSEQVKNDNLLPDWKLHISVHPKDEPKAFNIIKELFFSPRYPKLILMKIKYGAWAKFMYGREITIYMYTHQKEYEDNGVTEMSKSLERSEKFWFRLVGEIEYLFDKAQIRPNVGGLNPGDYPLGKHVSLRNEAFVNPPKDWKPPKGMYWFGWDYDNLGIKCFVYPPNDLGWNSTNHKCPLNLKKWDLVKWKKVAQRNHNWNKIKKQISNSFSSEIKLFVLFIIILVIFRMLSFLI
ncbi:hypothetical protein M0813_13704 [Anaeramoeba flamelloides]|uniref:Uncharacterized protein n=1 Tax=Anaeramoeba flamelloides TaxID=1746091 RepID=A0ABQ8Z7H8_9EUKA|nr:hypothetical protein M0813_13704 [Anaeramoeba flamelloides]